MCKKFCLFTAIAVAALAVLIGLGLKGHFGLWEMLVGPMVSFGLNAGLFDNMLMPSVGDGVRPPFRCMATTQAHFEKMLQWKPDKEDVIISTFPKAGSHMLGQLVLQTIHDGELDFASWNTELILLEFARVTPEACNDPTILTPTNHKELRPGVPGVVLTHVPATYAFYPGGPRHIVICRHPEDVLLSLFNMLESFADVAAPNIRGTFRVFSEVSQGWAGFYSQWWELSKKHPDNVLFLFYEDVLRDVSGTIRSVAKFLHHPITEEAVDKVKFLSSMGYMKKHETKFDFPESCQKANANPLSSPKSTKRMMHKGVAGRGKELPEDIRRDLKAQILGGLPPTSDFPIRRYYAD